MKFQEQTFEDQRIDLDENEYIGCTISRCIVAYKGTGHTVLRMNKFNDPRWVFEGPAGQTIRFLRTLYHGGGKDLVEQIIDGIREPMSEDDQLRGLS